jgi:hypothetical protein
MSLFQQKWLKHAVKNICQYIVWKNALPWWSSPAIFDVYKFHSNNTEYIQNVLRKILIFQYVSTISVSSDSRLLKIIFRRVFLTLSMLALSSVQYEFYWRSGEWMRMTQKQLKLSLLPWICYKKWWQKKLKLSLY